MVRKYVETVNTGPHFQEPLTPVPSHRGPGISGARAGASLEAGDTGRREQASQPTPVHTVQVSDQQCSGDTGPIMLLPTHVRGETLTCDTHCTALHCTINNMTSVFFLTGFSPKRIPPLTDQITFYHLLLFLRIFYPRQQFYLQMKTQNFVLGKLILFQQFYFLRCCCNPVCLISDNSPEIVNVSSLFVKFANEI